MNRLSHMRMHGCVISVIRWLCGKNGVRFCWSFASLDFSEAYGLQEHCLQSFQVPYNWKHK
jgi:hypothetical protein